MEPAPPEKIPKRKGAGALFAVFPLWIWLAFSAMLGGVIGLGGFTFSYAQGLSYFSTDPKACVNCHIMQEVYDGWNHGSHKAVAACNDCHTPHDNIVAKYAVKGLNGLRHSVAFTTGAFPEPIRITPLNHRVTEHACLSCHGDMVSAISHEGSDDPTDCLTCHQGVGHGKLSAK
jgi:cytochrome c nitrite reductase small subunit